jgi:hypothetical protein
MISKKENGLREIIRKALKKLQMPGISMSWVESHSTSPGIPDISYCCYGVEGWIELKCGPGIEVRPSQVLWMEERIKAGGSPLFLVQWEDTFYIVPGHRAAALRSDPSEEGIRGLSSTVWTGELPIYDFLTVIRNPHNEYRKSIR